MLNGGTIDHVIERQHLKSDIVEKVCGLVSAFCDTHKDMKFSAKEESPFCTSIIVGDYDLTIDVAASGKVLLKGEFFDEIYDSSLPEYERHIRFAAGDDADAVMGEIVVNIMEMDERPVAQRLGQFISNTYFSETVQQSKPSPEGFNC